MQQSGASSGAPFWVEAITVTIDRLEQDLHPLFLWYRYYLWRTFFCFAYADRFICKIHIPLLISAQLHFPLKCVIVIFGAYDTSPLKNKYCFMARNIRSFFVSGQIG